MGRKQTHLGLGRRARRGADMKAAHGHAVECVLLGLGIERAALGRARQLAGLACGEPRAPALFVLDVDKHLRR